MAFNKLQVAAASLAGRAYSCTTSSVHGGSRNIMRPPSWRDQVWAAPVHGIDQIRTMSVDVRHVLSNCERLALSDSSSKFGWERENWRSIFVGQCHELDDRHVREGDESGDLQPKKAGDRALRRSNTIEAGPMAWSCHRLRWGVRYKKAKFRIPMIHCSIRRLIVGYSQIDCGPTWLPALLKRRMFHTFAHGNFASFLLCLIVRAAKERHKYMEPTIPFGRWNIFRLILERRAGCAGSAKSNMGGGEIVFARGR
ncbi:hypothetical protein B0H13DRAFT_1884483 [Mycena leptocephala]|nr:hypothetical protein B0H13DRAFT_1884483 [Mycena leptocephala]